MPERVVHRIANTCDYLSYANSASAAQRSTQEHPGKRLDPKRAPKRALRTCLTLLAVNEALTFGAIAGLQLLTSGPSFGQRLPVSPICKL